MLQQRLVFSSKIIDAKRNGALRKTYDSTIDKNKHIRGFSNAEYGSFAVVVIQALLHAKPIYDNIDNLVSKDSPIGLLFQNYFNNGPINCMELVQSIQSNFLYNEDQSAVEWLQCLFKQYPGIAFQFRITVTHSLKCKSCNHRGVTITIESIVDLELPISDSTLRLRTNLQEIINYNFNRKEESENVCPECGFIALEKFKNLENASDCLILRIINNPQTNRCPKKRLDQLFIAGLNKTDVEIGNKWWRPKCVIFQPIQKKYTCFINTNFNLINSVWTEVDFCRIKKQRWPSGAKNVDIIFLEPVKQKLKNKIEMKKRSVDIVTENNTVTNGNAKLISNTKSTMDNKVMDNNLTEIGSTSTFVDHNNLDTEKNEMVTKVNGYMNNRIVQPLSSSANAVIKFNERTKSSVVNTNRNLSELKHHNYTSKTASKDYFHHDNPRYQIKDIKDKISSAINSPRQQTQSKSHYSLIRGLPNAQMGCFANVIIQSLFHMQAIKDNLMELLSDNDLLKIMFEKYFKNPDVDSLKFRRSIDAAFDNLQQHDACDWLQHLLQKYEQIEPYFSVQVTIHVECRSCPNNNYRRPELQNLNIITLSIPEFDEETNFITDLQSLINFNYNTKSQPDEPCRGCRRNDWETWHEISNVGQFITVQVVLHRQKIIINQGKVETIMYKLKNVIINDLTSEIFNIARKKWIVKSIIFHEGDSLSTGHYFCYLRVSDNNRSSWTKVNDLYRFPKYSP